MSEARSVLDRIQTVLVIVAILLAGGIAAAIAFGLLSRSATPVGYPETSGTVLIHERASGQRAGAVLVAKGRLGIGMRCQGAGPITVTVSGVGQVRSSCQTRDDSNGGFVISDVQNGPQRWDVATGTRNRWALVLTQPASLNGVTYLP